MQQALSESALPKAIESHADDVKVDVQVSVQPRALPKKETTDVLAELSSIMAEHERERKELSEALQSGKDKQTSARCQLLMMVQHLTCDTGDTSTAEQQAQDARSGAEASQHEAQGCA